MTQAQAAAPTDSTPTESAEPTSTPVPAQTAVVANNPEEVEESKEPAAQSTGSPEEESKEVIAT